MNWENIDTFVHLHGRWIPRFIAWFACYKYDRSLGLTRAEAKIGWLY